MIFSKHWIQNEPIENTTMETAIYVKHIVNFNLKEAYLCCIF